MNGYGIVLGRLSIEIQTKCDRGLKICNGNTYRVSVYGLNYQG